MKFIILLNVVKTKKVLFPGIHVKDLKPMSSLLSPRFLVIPLVFMSLISQISDNLKNVLSPREIQQLSSVRFYTKILSSGISSINLSVIYAISKTLGPELEILSVLSTSERLQFLNDLKKKIILDKNIGKVISKPQLLYNPLELMKHRNGLSLQTRSIMIASSIFSPNSVVTGITVSNINLKIILDSAKMLWSLLNLDDEEFDFLLRKDAFSCLKRFSSDLKSFQEPYNNLDSLKILVFSECKYVFNLNDILSFSEDQIIIQGENNLTSLEKELGFIERSIIELPDDIFIQDSQLGDVILRASLDQRRRHKIEVDNILKKSNNFVYKKKNKLNLEVLNRFDHKI